MKHPILIQLFTALTLLTRIPSPQFPAPSTKTMGKATLFYPLIGLLIGLVLLTIATFSSPNKALIIAAVITLLWAAITGGLHLDGLADSADAWLGGMGNTEKIDTILKDPTLGTAGVISISGVLLLKATALAILLQQQEYIALLIAPIIGRSFILILFLTTPYVRKQGMASELIHYIPKKIAITLCIFIIILAGWASSIALAGVLIGFYLLRRMMIKYLKGCTGDTVGATVEVSEMLYLLGTALSI